MTAILTKPLKNGIKTITGTIIQDGMTKIILAVTDTKGNKIIQSFKKSDYTINRP